MQKSKHKLLYTILGIVVSISCLLCGVSLAGEKEVYAQNQVVSQEVEALPTSYSLFNVNGITVEKSENLPYRVGNQSGAGICWAFGSLTAFETTLRMTNVVDKNFDLNFSEADMAYYIYVEARGSGNVGGGAFEFAYEYLTRGVGVAKEQSWETSSKSSWSGDSTLKSYYESQIKSNQRVYLPYEAKESINFPSRTAIEINNKADNISDEQTEQDILALRNSIKKHISTYGAVTASIYYNGGNYFNNETNTYIYKGTNTVNHLIAVVGWDDEITDGNGNTGAYICQNSYGSNFGENGFFYVMYNDSYIEDNVSGFVRVGEIENENVIIYDKMGVEGAVNKNQFCVFSGLNYSTTFIQLDKKNIFANIFERKDYENQYVSRIKVPAVSTVSMNSEQYYSSNNPTTNFNIYIASGISTNDLTSLSTILAKKFPSSTKVKNSNVPESQEFQFTSQQTGFYYIDLSEEIELTGEYFVVFMQVDAGASVFAGNNSANITYPTYRTSNINGTSGWGKYSIGSSPSYDSVLPMIVESKIKGEISFSIEEKDIKVTYDGKSHNPQVSVQTPTTGVTVTYSVDGGDFVDDINLVDVKWGKDSNGNKVVLPYKIIIKFSANFYESRTEICYVQIDPQPLTITPIERTITYGDDDNQIFNFDCSGLADGEKLEYNGGLQRDVGSNVGEYAITIGDFKLIDGANFKSSNYTLIFDGTKIFTIAPKVLRITASPNKNFKYYGDDDPEIHYEIIGVVGDEVPNAKLYFTREIGDNAGTYKYSLLSTSKLVNDVDSKFYANNYTFELTADSELEIKQRVIKICFDKIFSKKVGESDPEFNFTLENICSGETAEYEGTLSRESGGDVGQYRILIGSLSFVNGDDGKFLASNYTFELEESYLYITNGTFDASYYVSDKTATYDGNEHFIDLFINESMSVRYCEGKIYSEENSSITSIGRKDVGTTTLTLKFSMKNYEDSYATVSIVILPATVYVTPNSGQSTVYGNSDYKIEYTYLCDVDGETPAFDGKLTKKGAVAVGEYEITIGSLKLVDSGAFKKDNYKIQLNGNVKFNIIKKELKIVPTENLSKKYGEVDPVFTFTLSGIVYDDDVTYSGELEREIGESVGTYKYKKGSVALTSCLNNYTFSENIDGSFIISKAILEIKLLDMSSQYGNLDLDFKYEFLNGTEGNIVSSDSVASIVEFICNDSRGNPISNTTRKNSTGYTISACSKNQNYDVIPTEGIYTITYKECKITFTYLDQTESFSVLQFGKIKEPTTINTNVTGYKFLGWQIENETVDISTYEVKDDVTFVGGYQIIPYSIEYKLFGGEIAAEELRTTFDVTTETFSLPIPTRARYNFKGWYEDSSYKNKIEEVTKGTAKNLVLYAKWEGEPCTMTIPTKNEKFEVQGDEEVKYGAQIEFYVILQSGYSKSKDSLKVFIIWDNGEKEEAVSSRTSLSYSSISSLFSNEEVNINEDPIVKLEYSIKKVKGNFTIEVDNVTINIYKIEYIIDDAIVDTKELQHGQSLPQENIPTIPEKEHYTQVAPVWDIPVIENIQSDKIIHAVYTPDVYNVTFKFEDGQTVTETVTYGTVCSTEALNEVYDLKFLEHFEFDVALNNITEDTTINVKIVNNRKILYIALGVLAGVVIIGVIVGAITRKRKHKFNWWSYNK